jgi:hypothetical protein
VPILTTVPIFRTVQIVLWVVNWLPTFVVSKGANEFL